MHLIADRQGRRYEENSIQDRFLEMLYGHAAGRFLLRPLVSPAFSRAGGVFLDSRASKFLIRPFVRSHGICMKDYEKREYISYNDFFKRKLAEGARQVDESPDAFISPCDSVLGVYKIDKERTFYIKNTRYTTTGLLRNRTLAQSYVGGYIWVFRLRVQDYHRYIYVDEGRISQTVRLPGVFHTVNPAANDRFPIYKENTREYSLLHSEHFGPLVQMEVGAMLVGRIENRPGKQRVHRGEEKGNFAFGGSTVILMTRKGAVCPDRDILGNSRRGIETQVKLGERIGKRMERREGK